MSTAPKHPGNAKPDFLVFSDDWGEHPSSCQHLFRHIAQDHRVLWVNTIGMRNPTLTMADVHKIMRKVSKMIGMRRASAKGVESDGNITVCQPFMLPGIRSPLVRAFNARSVTSKVNAMLKALRFDDPVIVTSVPNAAEYPDLLRGRKVIYYCVDDFSLWPGLDAQLVNEMEARLIERADGLIAVSETLYQRLAIYGKPTNLLTHGVDVEFFSTPADHEHSLLGSIPKPRVGFFGLLDGRMNWDLVNLVADKMPTVSFVFAGPIDASAGVIPRAGNIHLIGPVHYQHLPEFIAGIDVFMLPYKTGRLAEALSPLKLKEYLATGAPIVSTPISQARTCAGTVIVAETAAEWETHLREIMRCGCTRNSDSRVPSLLTDSWRTKASELLQLCTDGHDRANNTCSPVCSNIVS